MLRIHSLEQKNQELKEKYKEVKMRRQSLMSKSNPVGITNQEPILKSKSGKQDKKVRINIQAEISTFNPEIFEHDEFQYDKDDSYNLINRSGQKRRQLPSPAERNNYLTIVNENESQVSAEIMNSALCPSDEKRVQVSSRPSEQPES